MGTLVQQHAAPFPGPGCPPASGIIVPLGPVPVSDDPVHPLERAHLTAFQQFLHSPVNTVGPLVEHEGQGLPCPLRGPDHPLRPVCLHRCGFFAENIQSRFQGCHRQRLMLKMRYCDQYRVTGTGSDQLPAVPENSRAVRQRTPGPFPAFRPQVRNGRQPDLRALSAQDQPAVFAAHVSDPDNSQADLFSDLHLFPFILTRDHGSRVYLIRIAFSWASRLSSAALKACAWVMAFSVRFRQSRISWPKKGYPVTPTAFTYFSPCSFTTNT